MSSDPESDRLDLGALRAGEEQALNRLMQRWERPLFAFAYRYLQNAADAQDVVVETFVRLYEHRGELAPDTRVSSWLFTLVANQCRNQLRWRRRHPSVALEPAEPDFAAPSHTLADDRPTPDASAAAQEVVEAIQHCVEELPHDLRVTVLLYYYERLSYREIGTILECSERGVETRLYRARQYMKPVLLRFFEQAPAN